MGDYLQHVGTVALCPHGGSISVISTNVRVKAMGQLVAVLGDTYMVGGCPFQIPGPVSTIPQPCLSVQWFVPALRVKVMGRPVLLKSSTGLCLSAGPPGGAPNVQVTQMRVKGM
jgi:hypothetical protein